MMMLHQLLHFISFTGFFAVVAAQQQQQLLCSENEALLQVSYKLKEEEWNEKLPAPRYTDYPLLSIQPSGNVGNTYSSVYYEELSYTNYSSLVDHETCIPRDGCTQVIVGMLPIDSYDIIWDGDVMQTGQPVWDTYSKNGTSFPTEYVQFPVTSTDIGTDCFPTCEEDEELFDHQQYTGYPGNTGHDIRVEDEEGNTVIDCNGWTCLRNEDTSFFKYRTCLQADKCYSFLIGSRYKSIFDNRSYSLRYNDELVAQSDNWRIDQAYFGSGCQPQCTGDESQVEMLASRGWSRSCTDEEETVFSWNVSEATISNEKNESIVASGIFPRCGNKTLFHETVCVPKDSCSSFNLSPHEDLTLDEDINYVISMDGVMYRNTRWDTISRQMGMLDKDESTLLGKCTQSDCGPKEDFIEVSFNTPVEYVKDGINQTGIYSSDSPGYGHGIDWTLDYSEPLDRIRSVHESQYFVESVFELDTKYRALMCIPSVNCDCSDRDTISGERVCVPSSRSSNYVSYPSQQSFDVRMSVDAPVVDYIVKQNGVKVQSDIISAENKYTQDQQVASLGGDQCNKLSGGAIAGIVIGSVVALLALAGGSYMLYKKKHQSNQVLES